MAWFRVDDKLWQHPKVLAIPRAHRRNAMGTWMLAGTWAALNEQDGHIPPHMLDELACDPEDAAQLVKARLWHAAGHDCAACPQPRDEVGWVFHEWESLQPTKAELTAKRAADAERQRRHRARGSKGGTDDEDTRNTSVTRDKDVSNAPVRASRPGPARPGPSGTTGGGERPETSRARGVTEPPTCSKHPNGDSDQPCAGCQRVRKWRQQLEASIKADATERRRTCARCGGGGWIETDDGSPAVKCNHLTAITTPKDDQ